MKLDVRRTWLKLVDARFASHFLVLPAFLLILILSGCGGSREPLSVGINVWPGYEMVSLAEHLGYYQEEKVAVRLVEFVSLSDARRAYELGQIDGLATTMVEAVITKSHAGKNPKVIRLFDFSNGGDVIIAPKTIKDMRDLQGKKIAVESDSVGVYVLGRALELAGMGFAEVLPQSSDQASMERLLGRGGLAPWFLIRPQVWKCFKIPSATSFSVPVRFPERSWMFW